MQVYTKVLGSILLLIVVVGCATHDRATATTNRTSLAEISRIYADLVPYIYSLEAFQDSKNKLFIKTRMDQLNHQVDQMQKPYTEHPMETDPVVLTGLTNMKSSLEEGLGSFYVQSFSYAQKQLKQSFEDFVKLTAFIKTNDDDSDNWSQMIDGFQEKLNHGELANLHIAIQKHSKAVESLLANLKHEKLDPSLQMDLMKKLMVISIKNDRSPGLAYKIVLELRRNERLAYHKRILTQWSYYLRKAKTQSRAAVLAEALEAKSLANATYVEVLNKSVVLHRSLSVVEDKEKRARILFSLGQIYAKNEDLGFKDIAKIYFERCIKESPYSRMSERCYFDLEEEIRAEYGLTLADRLPKAEKYRMIELRYLTRPMISQKNHKISISNYIDY